MFSLLSFLLLFIGGCCVLSTPPPTTTLFSTNITSKLVGRDSPQPNFASAVALDRFGRIALVGAPDDNNNVGATCVFSRLGKDNTWVQTSKLVGTGGIGEQQQGRSLAINSKGTHALVGGWHDNNRVGAAWVFVRSGLSWSQQGNKLVGTGGVGLRQKQGNSVALNYDATYALVGADLDDGGVGATYVFVRSGEGWSQQGSKLVGTGGVGSYQWQGSSVAIDSDGTYALVGASGDNVFQGAAFVFFRSGSSWTQQGPKLVGTGGVGRTLQGFRVSLDSDATHALVGGRLDNNELGATWVFVRSVGSMSWTQQGAKLVGTGWSGPGQFQAHAISINSEGNIALVGAPKDDVYEGGMWVFTRKGSVWSQHGSKLAVEGGYTYQGWAVALSDDGRYAIMSGRDSDGNGAAWVLSNSCFPSNGKTQTQCDQVASMCASVGTPVRWAGLGCPQQKRDAGCVKADHCGFRCKSVCESEHNKKFCVWDEQSRKCSKKV